jgi:O-antigen/teichoic acid export membrane protein
MFVLAAQVGPTLVGYYAWMILGVTFLQTAFDASVRQVSVMALSSRAGLRFLERYRRIYAALGTFALLALLLLLFALAGPANTYSLVGLVPIATVPLLMSLSTILIADEQRRGGWKELALIQFRAVLIAFIITIPLLLYFPSLLGPAINLAVIEALIYVQLRRSRPHTLVTFDSKGASASNLKRRFREAFLYSTLGWGQSQLDRVAVGALGGSGLLGLYTFSWSLSRSLGDAISNGSVNVLRARIFAGSTSSSEAKSIVGKSLRQTLILVVAGILIVFGALYWVLPHILGPEWRSAINAAYILVLCTVPQAIASSSSVLLMHSAKMRGGLVVRVVGLACALPIGICAVIDLRLGASAALLREILMCVVSMLIVRREAPWLTIGAGLVCVLIMFVGITSMGLYSQ